MVNMCSMEMLIAVTKSFVKSWWAKSRQWHCSYTCWENVHPMSCKLPECWKSVHGKRFCTQTGLVFFSFLVHQSGSYCILLKQNWYQMIPVSHQHTVYHWTSTSDPIEILSWYRNHTNIRKPTANATEPNSGSERFQSQRLLTLVST